MKLAKIKSKIKSVRRRIVLKLRNHKRMVTVISSMVLFLIIIISGLLWSQQSWNSYQLKYTQLFNNAKTDINKIITKPTNKLNSIIQVQTKLTKDLKSYCEVDSLIKWQDFINQYSDKINDCKHQQTELSQLLIDLSNLTNYLVIENQLSTIISMANSKTDQDNQAGNWSGIEGYWRQAATDVSKLSATEQFKNIKALANSDFINIADAWKQLSSANDAENRQQFEVANSNLVQVYILLTTLSDSSKAEAEKLINILNVDYSKIY